MTPEQIGAQALALQKELLGMADIGFGNYKQELKEYRRIASGILSIQIELANYLAPIHEPLSPPDTGE